MSAEQVLVCQGEVNRSRADVLMTENTLKNMDVPTGLKEASSEGMSKPVRSTLNAAASEDAFNQRGETLFLKSFPAPVEKESLFIVKARFPISEYVGIQRASHPPTERHDRFPIPFPNNPDVLLGKVEVAEVKFVQFAQAQPAIQQQHYDSTVARMVADAFQKTIRILLCKYIWKPVSEPRGIGSLDWIVRY